MFPFIFAFILAIGIPFLPSSLHRALHLPSLRFNFLSASYAPERTFVSSSEKRLLLENSYPRDSSGSGESPQYLVFSHVSSPDHEVDSDVLAYMSFTEKLVLDYPQTSIWLILCAQLLYQLVEATVVMTLSFLFAATLLSRHSLSTLTERFYTALFICWNYTPKAALSSFLQDVLLCIHKYWMDNSVTSDQTPITATNISQRDPLGVLASNATIPEDLDLIASKEAIFWSEHSSGVALITPPRSRETSAPAKPALIPLGQPVDPIEPHPFRSTSSSIVTRARNQNASYTGASTSNAKVDLSGTEEVAASLSHSSTPSFVTISMQDMYNANTVSTSISGGDRGTKASDAISGSSLGHGSNPNTNSTTSKPELDESQAGSFRSSSSETSYSGRRRFKSDGIQVRSAHCHLGDSAAPPDPAKVDGTCAFWKSAVQHDEQGGGVSEKQVLAPGFPSGRSRTSRSKPDLAVAVSNVGSPLGSPDTVLAGIILTPEGEMLVPASQRADGSMRKEIKVRPGHLLREPLADKYRPPAARVRTSTWDPRLREHLATPPSSPYARNFPLPFTPMSVHQRLFGRQCDSPAALSNNWRRSSWNSTVVETPPPSLLEKLPAPEFSTPSQSEAIASPMSVRALTTVDNQSSFGDQLTISRPSELKCAEKVVEHVPSHSTEQTESSKPVRAAAEVCDKANSAASFSVEEESRLPLRDITTSLLVTEAVECLNPPATPTVLASTTARTPASSQVAHVIQRVLEAPSRNRVMESRGTLLSSPHRKRKPSGEPKTLCAVKSAMLSPSESPTPAHYRRPRTRRSAPHLGKSPGNKQQVKTQTPEGSVKRRRMRTASALGVENVAVAVTATAAAAVDRSGQIVLPAGTGWKGRSLTESLLPVAQRQRQPTLASGATTQV